MGERNESGGNGRYEGVQLPVNEQLMKDLADLPALHRELDAVKKRIEDAEGFIDDAKGGRLPFGLRLFTISGGEIVEIWRPQDGQYTPYGRVFIGQVDYPFIGDRAEKVKMGNEEVVLLIDTQNQIAAPVDTIVSALRTDDIRSEDMYTDYDEFIDLFNIQDGYGQVTSGDLLGPTEAPQI